ncbi:hypothetical protein [Sphingomonas sp. PAMC 26605]|uniref:hypothetical protein n=1 Tax=Sphingomonas sp. PAMC 26605 TaxID=1112214 RepID=UPI00026CAC12|nr:hypothetical protein [Sphingomonas sp. PAMC 26605]
MATNYDAVRWTVDAPMPGSLADPTRAILGPVRDALLFWGAPLFAFLAVELWLGGWALAAPHDTAAIALKGMFAVIAVTTWAHLIAVVPRAYGNRTVFAAHRGKLTVAPIALIATLFLSPLALVAAGVLAVFWDIYHSAMQNFGFARIYDMKAGNPPEVLRRTDLRLNTLLYVGPLAAGAALATHLQSFAKFDKTALSTLASLPGVLAGYNDGIRAVAVLAYAVVLGWAIVDYRRAMRAGYRLPAHKLATLVATGTVSIIAWGFTPPIVALAVINLYHAVQYFALVWVKEGGRMTHAAGGRQSRAMLYFWGGSILFGLAYAAAMTGSVRVFLAPFIACSLLHFWYDSFIWSVARKHV